MADKLKYITNAYTQNYPFCRLQLVVEKLGYSTCTNQSKLNKIPNPKVVQQTPLKFNRDLNF